MSILLNFTNYYSKINFSNNQNRKETPWLQWIILGYFIGNLSIIFLDLWQQSYLLHPYQTENQTLSLFFKMSCWSTAILNLIGIIYLAKLSRVVYNFFIASFLISTFTLIITLLMLLFINLKLNPLFIFIFFIGYVTHIIVIFYISQLMIEGVLRVQNNSLP